MHHTVHTYSHFSHGRPGGSVARRHGGSAAARRRLDGWRPARATRWWGLASGARHASGKEGTPSAGGASGRSRPRVRARAPGGRRGSARGRSRLRLMSKQSAVDVDLVDLGGAVDARGALRRGDRAHGGHGEIWWARQGSGGRGAHRYRSLFIITGGAWRSGTQARRTSLVPRPHVPIQ